MTVVLGYTPGGGVTAPPTLDQAVAALRQDLFDRAASMPLLDGVPAPQRWADGDLVRALDRAIDAYSAVAPLVQSVLVPTLPGYRSYALPPGAWWVESVEYPAGQWPRRFVAFEEEVTPGLGVAAAPETAASGSGPLSGAYAWSVTFVKSGGETLPGPLSVPLALAGQAALVSGIATGPPGTVGRNVYRAQGGGAPGLVARLPDNTTTELLDTLPDSALGPAPPAADTTANLIQVTLKLPPGLVPADASGTIVLTYASWHVLAGAGTSLPERHLDVVMLGAAAYALLAYQVPTNDLFDYQDGELHDRVDERKVPAAWLSAGTALLERFQDRLETVKRERNAGLAAVAQWGDVPVRWRWT